METKTRTEAESVASIAAQAYSPTEVEAEKVYIVADGEGGLEILDTDKYGDYPRRKTGNFRVESAEAFNRYLGKHYQEETEVWADTAGGNIHAVLNAHDRSVAGWGDHSLHLALAKTPEWDAWAEHSGKLMGQTEFAEFIEDRATDIRTPASADVLELAQTFQARRGTEFESATRLSDGNIQVEYREDTKATAGKKAQLAIPDVFELGLVPYEGADRYKVIARFRYRLNGPELRLGFKLDNPERILRDAFTDIAVSIETKTIELGANFYHGRG